MAHVILPPNAINFPENQQSVFLAGSIEMGQAIDWQLEVTSQLQDLPIVVLNPRREAWDATWEQTITNPQFRQQVDWEIDAQERADVIAMYFAPTTKAPITLLELGLFARTGKVIVCCPPGYWRRGNVEVVCHRFGIPLFSELGELVAEVRKRISS